MKPTVPAIPKFALRMEEGNDVEYSAGPKVLASRKIYIPHADGSRTAVILFSRVSEEKLTALRAENKIDSAEKTAKALGKLREAQGASKLQVYQLMNVMRREVRHDDRALASIMSKSEQHTGIQAPSIDASRSRATSAPESRNKPVPKQKLKELQQKYVAAPRKISAGVFSKSFSAAIKSGQMIEWSAETIKQLETPAQREEPRATALPKPTKPLPVPPQRPLKSGAGKPLPQIPGQSVPATPKSVAIDPNTSKKLDPAG